MKLYLKREKSGIEAELEFDKENNTYTVLKGSKISSEITYSEKFRGAKSIEKAREGVVDGTLLIKDVTFKSASTAANFVTGTSTNGLKVWKDKKGTTLKELISSEEVKEE